MVKKIKAGSSQLEVAQISLGCMRIAELTPQEADVHIHSAVEAGIDFFDHADIYADGVKVSSPYPTSSPFTHT